MRALDEALLHFIGKFKRIVFGIYREVDQHTKYCLQASGNFILPILQTITMLFWYIIKVAIRWNEAR